VFPVVSTRGRRWALLGAALLLVSGAVAVWRGRGRAPAVVPVEPPLPADIEELRSKDPELLEAIYQARQGVREKPTSALAWGHLGLTLMAHRFGAEARVCFAEALRLDPDNALWPFALGLLVLSDDPSQALSYLRQAEAIGASSPDRAVYRLQLADALFELRHLTEAEAIYRDEWERDPENLQAAFGLGQLAVERGDDRAAVELLTKAWESPSARKRATASLAVLARARGDNAAAVRWEQEVADMPDDMEWRSPLGEALADRQVGRRKQMRELVDLEKARRFQEAADLCLRLLPEAPSGLAYVSAGMNLMRIRDYERAQSVLREGTRLDPNNGKLHYTLALALFCPAERAWQESPGQPQARERFREAVEHARRATELRPNFGRSYVLWGLSLKYLGDPAAAVEPLRKAVSCLPTDFDAHLGLGEVLLDSGRWREAEEHLENARRLGPQDPRVAKALERLRAHKD
jgi:tetratricopeptide (TPR) repeat protein